jgi:carbon-monoxide dehydrogenase medium subunit
MPQFTYSAPDNLEAAVTMLKENEAFRPLAGGQSLLVDLKRERTSVEMVVDLQHIPDLHGIHMTEAGLDVGALTTLTEMAASEVIRKNYTALAEAAESVGDLQTRNLSTLGGSLAYNDPSGDLAAPVLVLGGVIQATGAGGSRAISASEFFIGPFKTALLPSELITNIFFPAPKAEDKSAYEKFKNPATGFAVCGVAARIIWNKQGYVYKLAVTGALEHPCLLAQLQDALANKAPTSENIKAAVSRIEFPLSARDDLHASGEYRLQLAKVLATRAIGRIALRINPESVSS